MNAVATSFRTDYSAFLNGVSAAQERLLMLDYDGTLAPFIPQRTKAVPYRRIPELLSSLMAGCRTRVALVTSRSAREVPKLLGIDPAPEVRGSYGLERLMPSGAYEIGYIPEEGRKALEAAARWSQAEGLGTLTEVKPGAIALHWRGLSAGQIEALRSCAYTALAPLACRGNLLLGEFDGGLELRLRACNKGQAVHSLLAETDPATPVAYLGDDLADEDAFRALQERGLTVLVRSQYRPTAAQLWLKPPEELIQFLTDWVCSCGGVA